MKKVSTGLNSALFAVLTASLLLGFAGSASADTWSAFKSKHDYNEAVHYMNNGYAEIGKVYTKLDAGKSKSAVRHFNYAMKDFNKAVEYYAKAELPKADKDAVKALQNGLTALQKSVKAIEKGDYAAAQNDYDTAQNYFAEASLLLD